jgi:hypothetical protein
MIVVKLMGGLGNQLFQYAAGRSLAQKRGTSVVFDTTFLNKQTDAWTKRQFELAVFSFQPKFLPVAEVSGFQVMQDNALRRVADGYFPFLFSKHYFKEKKFAFDPNVLTQRDNTLLDGFWQTERYFIEQEALIRSELKFSKPFDGLNADLAKRIQASQSAAIHVRRGDYILNKTTQAFHGSCDIDYYKRAVADLSSRISDLDWYVFSDDATWVKEQFQFLPNMQAIDHNTGEQSYADMHLMSLCKHQIIANSSFSWWGAWLNANPSKRVIAPAKWLAKEDIDTSDIYPGAWIKL